MQGIFKKKKKHHHCKSKINYSNVYYMSSHKTQNDGGYKVQRMQKLESISDYRSLRGGVFERQLKLNKIENLKNLPKINLLKTNVYVKNSSIVSTH